MRLHRSVLAVSICAALAAPAAQAVWLNPEGHGQALIYPYYSVRSAAGNAFNTLISVVNQSAQRTAVRVRLREGRNGQEVLAFNLLLAPNDVWTGAVVPDPATGGARLITADASCTSPAFAAGAAALPSLPLSSAAYSGANADTYGEGIDRTREGYVEILSMAAIGANPTCAAYAADPNLTLSVEAAGGALAGTATLINVMSGLDFTVPAVALANLTTQPFYRPVSDPYPDFNANEVERFAQVSVGGKTYYAPTPTGAEAVSVALLRNTLENEVALDANTLSATDWIVTMPTKRFFPGAPPSSPSINLFSNSYIPGTRDVEMRMLFWPRDGTGFSIVRSCGFLCPPELFEADMRLPFSATVVGFRNGAQSASAAAGTSLVTGSTNAWMVTLPTTAPNGKIGLSYYGFDGVPNRAYTAFGIRSSDGVVAQETIRILGLPAIGMMLRTFQNGTLTCGAGACQGNYGGAFVHKAQRGVAP